jgi:hypothetical protein
MTKGKALARRYARRLEHVMAIAAKLRPFREANAPVFLGVDAGSEQHSKGTACPEPHKPMSRWS